MSEEQHEKGLGGDFLVSVSPLRDAAGNLSGRVHFAREISDRRKQRLTPRMITLLERLAESVGNGFEHRKAQEALRESVERLRLALHAAGTGISEKNSFQLIKRVIPEDHPDRGYGGADRTGDRPHRAYRPPNVRALFSPGQVLKQGILQCL